MPSLLYHIKNIIIIIIKVSSWNQHRRENDAGYDTVILAGTSGTYNSARFPVKFVQ